MTIKLLEYGRTDNQERQNSIDRFSDQKSDRTFSRLWTPGQ